MGLFLHYWHFLWFGLILFTWLEGHFLREICGEYKSLTCRWVNS